MASLNRCDFIGRVGKQPEIRENANGTKIACFSIAVSEKYKGEEHTEWVNMVFFGKLAEIIEQYVGKGQLLYISGRMQTRKWTDKDGADRYTTEIVGEKMQMLGGKKESSGGGGGGYQANEPSFNPDDDIPFNRAPSIYDAKV